MLTSHGCVEVNIHDCTFSAAILLLLHSSPGWLLPVPIVSAHCRSSGYSLSSLCLLSVCLLLIVCAFDAENTQSLLRSMQNQALIQGATQNCMYLTLGAGTHMMNEGCIIFCSHIPLC